MYGVMIMALLVLSLFPTFLFTFCWM